MDPHNLNKYLYIKRTRTWLVRSLYAFGIISWLLLLYAYSFAIIYIPFYRYFVAPILLFFTIYTFLSYGIILLYKRPNLKKHLALVESFWQKNDEPSVDIFLPICGEEINILRNTWENVHKLKYKNFTVYVLDDSRTDCDVHSMIAKQYGFTYLERPNKGEMKKAGNLKYGYENSSSEFIVIFDADFAPHPDFLRELLPYMNEKKVGIVQSPQYFETTKQVYKRSPLEYGAAYVQQDFYRVIQVARDRIDGALCCGSNAVYRRSALDSIGGTVQVDHSEDARTGIALLNKGWITRYVPVILAVGLCPDDAYSYFHQQHRWCSGSMALLSSKKEFWSAKIPLRARLCYLSGCFYYVHYPLGLLVTFQLFFTLFFYNSYISIASLTLYLPYIIFSLFLLPLYRLTRLRRGTFITEAIQLYSYTHAVASVLLFRKAAKWIPANAKQTEYSQTFIQVTELVAAYFLLNIILIALAIRDGLLHVLNYNYYSIQFWLFWNVAFAATVLWYFYRAMENIQKKKRANERFQSGLVAWQLKTAGLFTLLVTGVFFAIVYL